MAIQPVKNNVRLSCSKGAQAKPNKKKVALALGASVLLAGGLIAFANYNKIGFLKKAADSLGLGKDMTAGLPDKQKDFLKLCKSTKLENYVLSPENLNNKIFTSDLHSHSNHSDGWGSVSNLLDEVARYADELHEKTGQKFNFALTDHDRVSGIREANEIIKNNPEKFKNLNFIPGVELSFSFNSNNQVKSGEILAYFIDPNSKSMQTLVEDLNQNRQKMITDCIKKLGDGFSRSDLDDYFLNHDGETFAYNLHYRLRNYAQIKNRVNQIAKNTNKDPNELYKKLMDGYVFGSSRVAKPFVSPDGFDKYLKRLNMGTETNMIDENINKICDEFFPKIVDGKVTSNTENSFEKIIDTLKDDNNVILGFAHPYFTAEQMTDYKKEFSGLLKYAKGKVKLTENYHQAYSSKIPKDKIEAINQYLLKQNLIPIGGRDNHCTSFFG